MRRHVGGLKLGLEFFSANGPAGVREMAHHGLPIFLDLKLHDIPNTVGKAVQALHALEPAILTVHAAGGRAMLEDAKAAAPQGTKVVAVTMLTSLDEADLAATGVNGDAHDHVVRLTALARAAGLDGVVCSGAEVATAKALWPEGFFVVPGVRPPEAARATRNASSPRARRSTTAPRSSSSAGRSRRPTIPTRPPGRSKRRSKSPRPK